MSKNKKSNNMKLIKLKNIILLYSLHKNNSFIESSFTAGNKKDVRSSYSVQRMQKNRSGDL